MKMELISTSKTNRILNTSYLLGEAAGPYLGLMLNANEQFPHAMFLQALFFMGLFVFAYVSLFSISARDLRSVVE